MDQKTKQRLVGMTVVFAVAVIFLPMILDGSGIEKTQLSLQIPEPPELESVNNFEQKIAELHASVDALPELQAQFIDEKSSSDDDRNSEARNDKQVIPRQTGEIARDVTGGDSWVLQVGSFSDRERAFAQRDLLRQSNIASVFIERFDKDRKPVYRVRLGPFVDRDKTRVAQNKIRAKYNIDGLIMKYEK